jgi:ubiquitin
MQILVKTPDGKTMTIEVKPSDAVYEVKKKVHAKEGIPVDAQRLFFGEEELDDAPTLSECHIRHGDTLDVEGMRIKVEKRNGGTISTDTVHNIKTLVQEKEGIPVKEQRLTFWWKGARKSVYTIQLQYQARIHFEFGRDANQSENTKR